MESHGLFDVIINRCSAAELTSMIRDSIRNEIVKGECDEQVSHIIGDSRMVRSRKRLQHMEE